MSLVDVSGEGRRKRGKKPQSVGKSFDALAAHTLAPVVQEETLRISFDGEGPQRIQAYFNNARRKLQTRFNDEGIDVTKTEGWAAYTSRYRDIQKLLAKVAHVVPGSAEEDELAEKVAAAANDVHDLVADIEERAGTTLSAAGSHGTVYAPKQITSRMASKRGGKERDLSKTNAFRDLDAFERLAAGNSNIPGISLDEARRLAKESQEAAAKLEAGGLSPGEIRKLDSVRVNNSAAIRSMIARYRQPPARWSGGAANPLTPSPMSNPNAAPSGPDSTAEAERKLAELLQGFDEEGTYVPMAGSPANPNGPPAAGGANPNAAPTAAADEGAVWKAGIDAAKVESGKKTKESAEAARGRIAALALATRGEQGLLDRFGNADPDSKHAQAEYAAAKVTWETHNAGKKFPFTDQRAWYKDAVAKERKERGPKKETTDAEFLKTAPLLETMYADEKAYFDWLKNHVSQKNMLSSVKERLMGGAFGKWDADEKLPDDGAALKQKWLASRHGYMQALSTRTAERLHERSAKRTKRMGEGDPGFDTKHTGKLNTHGTLAERYQRRMMRRDAIFGAREAELRVRETAIMEKGGAVGAINKVVGFWRKLAPAARTGLIAGGFFSLGLLTGGATIAAFVGGGITAGRLIASSKLPENHPVRRTFAVLGTIMGAAGWAGAKVVEGVHALKGTKRNAETTLRTAGATGEMSTDDIANIDATRDKAMRTDKRIAAQAMTARAIAGYAGGAWLASEGLTPGSFVNNILHGHLGAQGVDGSTGGFIVPGGHLNDIGGAGHGGAGHPGGLEGGAGGPGGGPGHGGAEGAGPNGPNGGHNGPLGGPHGPGGPGHGGAEGGALDGHGNTIINQNSITNNYYGAGQGGGTGGGEGGSGEGPNAGGAHDGINGHHAAGNDAGTMTPEQQANWDAYLAAHPPHIPPLDPKDLNMHVPHFFAEGPSFDHYSVSVDAHAGDGAIHMFEHMQKALQHQIDTNHLNVNDAPDLVKHILSTKAEALSRDPAFGALYHPGQHLDSADINIHAKMELTGTGNLVLHQDGHDTVLVHSTAPPEDSVQDGYVVGDKFTDGFLHTTHEGHHHVAPHHESDALNVYAKDHPTDTPDSGGTGHQESLPPELRTPGYLHNPLDAATPAAPVAPATPDAGHAPGAASTPTETPGAHPAGGAAPTAEATPVAPTIPEGVVMGGIHHDLPIDTHRAGIYEVTDATTGAKSLTAFGGTEQTRISLATDVLQHPDKYGIKPENYGNTIGVPRELQNLTGANTQYMSGVHVENGQVGLQGTLRTSGGAEVSVPDTKDFSSAVVSAPQS